MQQSRAPHAQQSRVHTCNQVGRALATKLAHTCNKAGRRTCNKVRRTHVTKSSAYAQQSRRTRVTKSCAAHATKSAHTCNKAGRRTCDKVGRTHVTKLCAAHATKSGAARATSKSTWMMGTKLIQASQAVVAWCGEEVGRFKPERTCLCRYQVSRAQRGREHHLGPGKAWTQKRASSHLCTPP